MGNKSHNKLIDSYNKTFGQNMPYAPDTIKNLGLKEYIKKKLNLTK